MKEEIKPVYYCEYCKKHLFRKSAMVKHELLCGGNPKNWNACNSCEHCEEIKVEYHIDHDYYGSATRETRGFKCHKLDKDLYPFKAVKKNLPARFPETFEGKEQMPNECEHYESIY